MENLMKIDPRKYIEDEKIDSNRSKNLLRFFVEYAKIFPDFVSFAEEFEQEVIELKALKPNYLLMIVSEFLSDFIKDNDIKECETHLNYIEEFLCGEKADMKEAFTIHFLDGFLNQFSGTDQEPLILDLVNKRATLQKGKLALDSFWGIDYT